MGIEHTGYTKMQINIAADFPLPGFWSNHACTEAVYEFDGQRYYLRQLDRHMLYRLADNPAIEHTLFVPYRAAGVDAGPSAMMAPALTPAMYPEAVFAEQIRTGQNGRFALYACPQARDCLAALFFCPDGTGRFLDYNTANGYSAHETGDCIEFLWEGSRYGITATTDILGCAWDKLLPLCEDVFLNQIWPRMKDPYVSYADFPDEPFQFTSGSEEELKHITRCICHTDEVLLTDETIGRYYLLYYAHTSQQAGGADKNLKNPRLKRLFALAFEANSFTGGTWVYSRYRENQRKKRLHTETKDARISGCASVRA